MTTNELTQYVMKYLRKKNILCWRHNNVGIWDAKNKTYRRNPQTLRGVADILGIDKFGRFVSVEIKANKDKLTDAQKLFLEQIKLRGGGAFVCKDFDEFRNEFEEWYGRTREVEQNR